MTEVLHLILEEKLRRKALRREQEAQLAAIKGILQRRFMFTASKRHVTRVTDLVAAVVAELGGVENNDLYILVRQAAEDLGGTPVSRANRRLMRGCHPAGMTDEEATDLARFLRSAPDLQFERSRDPASKTPYARRR